VVTATRTRPDRTADERTQLLGWFDLQRGIVRLKCEGLGDVDAHRALIPSSPLMTVAGILSHLRWCEELWFREVLLGQPVAQARRQQQLLLAIARDEVLRHHRRVLTGPDRPPLCATACMGSRSR